jgi:pimeloyl-ACP methyl ester carboxylesterase
VRNLTGLLLLTLPSLSVQAAAELVEGTIEGAPYQIAIPAQPNGNLLLHAHGYRPDESQLLAELELENTAHGELVDDGWLVATTAYRRNGMIIADAMEDVIRLRNLIVETHGPLALVIIEGQSMGGAIVIHQAERRPDLFNGALAIGAALQAKDPEDPLPLTHEPKLPILFLSNRSEISGPRAYVEAASNAPIAPALWKVERNGHVNVNQQERLLAIDGLVGWMTAGTIEASRDITIEVKTEGPKAQFGDSGATGRVIDVTHNHGNVFINFGRDDFARLGIAVGDDFSLRIGKTTVNIRYGTTFSDVPVGEWISFSTAEGDTIVAINYGNAFDHLGAVIGDTVRIEPIATNTQQAGTN